MSGTVQEQLGVAPGATHWDVDGYRLWESVDPDILLYTRHELRPALATDGRALVSIERLLEHDGGSARTTGGSASLTFLGAQVEDAAVVLSQQDRWSRVVRAGGYRGSTPGAEPRFRPLPVRDPAVSAELDPAQASVVPVVSGTGGSGTGGTTLRVTLTADGADAWARAVRDDAPLGGVVRLTYAYLQLLEPATATAQLHGSRVFTGLVAQLGAGPDGRPRGTDAEIRRAWGELVRSGAIGMTVTGLDPGDVVPADTRPDLIEQTFLTLFPSLFQAVAAATTGPPVYAFRWARAAEVPDLPIMVSVVGGWTWLDAVVEGSLGQVLATLPAAVVHDTYTAVGVPVEVWVDPDPGLDSVTVSLDFGDEHAPEVATFDQAGGRRAWTISTEHPDRLVVRHVTRTLFAPPTWPVITSTGTLGPDGYRYVVKPGAWVRSLVVLLVRLEDGVYVPPVRGAGGEALSVYARYENAVLPAAITDAAPIDEASPVTVRYPVPPGAGPGRLTVRVAGRVGDEVVDTHAEVPADDEAVVAVVDGSSLRILTGQDRLPEGLKRRLAAGARPVVDHRPPAAAEAQRPLSIALEAPLVAQPTTVSAWASVAAMLLRTTAAEAVTRIGLSPDTPQTWAAVRTAYVAAGLSVPRPGPLSPRTVAELLREHGPIGLAALPADDGDPAPGLVVVTGVAGDGDPATTWVTFHDPWPPDVGAVRREPFDRFGREFDAAGGTAVVHI